MKWHMNPTDMIAFDHLTVRYRSAERAVAAAIADVSLTVPQGTVFFLDKYYIYDV